MKQTAVEWFSKLLIDELTDNGIEYLDLVYEIIEQAKEMEKQQIINAVEWGNRKGYDEHRLTCILDEDEQYYNETYKKP
jgi:hypothetical protein